MSSFSAERITDYRKLNRRNRQIRGKAGLVKWNLIEESLDRVPKVVVMRTRRPLPKAVYVIIELYVV